mmetsp:Transcript_26574/g.81698  ORF Transcript_26574/g.81698 Transcript_26574/m.81698 type:complete len:124 (+) Transcript_26574:782-1153(+)
MALPPLLRHCAFFLCRDYIDSSSLQKEFRDCIRVGNFPQLGGSRFKDSRGAVQVHVKLKNSGNVSTTIAIVWCRPDCHNALVWKVEFETLHDKLVSARNEVKMIDLAKLLNNVCTEEIASTTR